MEVSLGLGETEFEVVLVPIGEDVDVADAVADAVAVKEGVLLMVGVGEGVLLVEAK